MNARTLATLLIAVVLGLVAVLLVRNYLTSGQRGASVVSAAGVTPIVVASAPIARGVAISPSLLKVVNYPADAVPAGAVRNVTDLGAPGPNGRLALRSFTANEPVLMTAVTGPGGRLTLAGTVDPGMRAVTIRSSDVAGVAGFVLPGDKVDILLTRTPLGETTPVTQVLAENVKVLGIDQLSNEEADKPVVSRTVTVEANPDQASLISLAQAVGSVTFTLRHVADDAALERHAVTVADLAVKGAHPVERAVPVKRKPLPGPPSDQSEVRVTRGTETSGYSVARF